MDYLAAQYAADFNPLPSCEGRLRLISSKPFLLTFQSTPLMRGETKFNEKFADIIDISIHSPHARGDLPRLFEILQNHLISIPGS